MATEWYYEHEGQKRGPVSSQQLKQLAVCGQLQPGSLVWKQGLANWVQARSVEGLFQEPGPSRPSEAVGRAQPAPGRPAAQANVAPAPPVVSPAAASQAGRGVPSPTPERIQVQSYGPQPSRGADRPYIRRKYPALRTLAVIYKVLGILLAIAAVIFLALSIFSATDAASSVQADDDLSAVLGGAAAVYCFVGFLGAAWAALIMLSIAEGIRLAIDIENNTRTTTELFRNWVRSAVH